MGSNRRWWPIALLALIVAGLSAVYVLAALSSPDSFGVYLPDTPRSAASSLQSRLQSMGEVSDVKYLPRERALAQFTREIASDPEYGDPQFEGPTLEHALVVDLAHPWNLLATRRVVATLQSEPGVEMRQVLPWWLRLRDE